MAQTLTSPSERLTPVDGSEAPMKLDLSVYVYGGHNPVGRRAPVCRADYELRTRGGGFALVFVVPE